MDLPTPLWEAQCALEEGQCGVVSCACSSQGNALPSGHLLAPETGASGTSLRSSQV